MTDLTGHVKVQFAGEWFDAVCDDEIDVTACRMRRCTLKHSPKALEHNLVSVTVWVPEERIQFQLLEKLSEELCDTKDTDYKAEVEKLLKELDQARRELEGLQSENKELHLEVSALKTTKPEKRRKNSSFASIAALFEDVKDDAGKPKRKKRCPSVSISNVLALEESEDQAPHSRRTSSWANVSSLLNDDEDAQPAREVAPAPKSQAGRSVVDSFGGVASLFMDQPKTRNVNPSYGGVGMLYGGKGRTASFSNVAELFSSDDEEEQSSLKPKTGVSNFDDSSKSMKRQPSSFGGIAALFENWDEVEDLSAPEPPKPVVSAPIGTRTSKRKISFDGVAAMFS